jgi:hypothetical protein
VVVVFQQPPATDAAQGCQIFIGATYQNGKNIPNDHKIYQMAIQFNKWPLKYGRKLSQMVLKYTSISHSKALQNIPKLGFLV